MTSASCCHSSRILWRLSSHLILTEVSYLHPNLFLSVNLVGYLSMTSTSCCHSSLYLISSHLILTEVSYLHPDLFLSVNLVGYLSMTSASCCHSSLSYLLSSHLNSSILSTSRPLFIFKFHRLSVYDERQLLPLQPILSPLILS
jgi:hypothetical protein